MFLHDSSSNNNNNCCAKNKSGKNSKTKKNEIKKELLQLRCYCSSFAISVLFSLYFNQKLMYFIELFAMSESAYRREHQKIINIQSSCVVIIIINAINIAISQDPSVDLSVWVWLCLCAVWNNGGHSTGNNWYDWQVSLYECNKCQITMVKTMKKKLRKKTNKYHPYR